MAEKEQEPAQKVEESTCRMKQILDQNIVQAEDSKIEQPPDIDANVNQNST